MSHSNASNFPALTAVIFFHENIGLAILAVANRYIHVKTIYFIIPTHPATICLDVPLFKLDDL
jgi:hypothetical protein